MKKIIPYKTSSGALAALDNGGRFYDLLSKAQDGNISSAELSKAAGMFSDQQKMMLFLEMSISELSAESRRMVISNLSDKLKKAHAKYVPLRMIPSEANETGKSSSSAIITGIPKLVDTKADFTGFIMMPIMTGNTTSFIMIPIIDAYDVYEMRDNETSSDFIIAHSRSTRKLPQAPVKCGGILKELKATETEEIGSKIFLETMYYTLA